MRSHLSCHTDTECSATNLVISKLRINFNPLILTLLVVALVETVTRFKVQVLGRLRLLSKRRARARAASPTLPPPSLSQFAHAAVLVRSRGLHLRSESLARRR